MSRVDAVLAEQWASTMLANYGVPKIELTHGTGAVVYDRNGNQYLDLLAGIAVSALGHADPRLTAAVSEQVSRLAHVSNLYAHAPGLALARKLLRLADSDGRVLFTQDGATANEAALKLVRRYSYALQPDGARQKVVAMQGGFHGRTMGALAVTGNPAKRDPFGPFGIDTEFVPFGDVDALSAAVTEHVAAVIVEPIQGEAGVVVPPAGYLEAVQAICQRRGALLVVDEVQSGIGRTGSWFRSHAEGVRPDIISLAKGLGGGLPLGALIVEPKLIDVFSPGDHGTTFGGNPVSCAAALAVIDAIESDGLLEHAAELGEWFMNSIRSLSHPAVSEVRGAGLWLGIQLQRPIAARLELAALEAGFLVNAAKPDVLRLAPPLVISKTQLESFLDVLPGLLDGAMS